jgi:hypothetical protein
MIATYIKSNISLDTAKQFCDWIAMLSQVIIFVSIGGVVFTESLARKLAKIVNDFQQATIESLLSRDEERAAAFRASVENIETAIEEKGNYKKKIVVTIGFLKNAYFDAAHIPQRYMMFATRGILFNFPGGLYGFFGFFFLSVQIVAISTKIVLDYLPSGCKW